MRKLPGLTVVALLLASPSEAAETACLPASVFTKNADGELPGLALGYDKGLLTLCAYEKQQDYRADKSLGCWTVDSRTAALSPSGAKALPGRGRRIDLDAQNCIEGYCIAPLSAEDHRPLFVISTNGSHAAILTDKLLYVFQTSTKTKVAEIALTDENAASSTSVTNTPSGLLFNGDTLFVMGADAGPFVGVWVFKDDGARGGAIRNGGDLFNISGGGYGILGDGEVALADAGLQNMMIVSGANTAGRTVRRSVAYAPCTKDQFDQWARGEDDQKGACKRGLEAKYEPYADMSPVLPPSGNILTPLSGPAQGYLVELDPKELEEIRRLPLARCR